jgi:hypothetical protein
MRKVAEYLTHAKECQQMAAKMRDPRQKQQLIEMANAWEMLAEERRRQLAKQAANGVPMAGQEEQPDSR